MSKSGVYGPVTMEEPIGEQIARGLNNNSLGDEPTVVVTDSPIPVEPSAFIDGLQDPPPGSTGVVALQSTVKDSNPKDAVGSTKVGLSNVSLPVLMEIAAGMTEGALKYGRHNYREIGVRNSVYFDATIRHLFAWWEGEDIDPDSGLSHVTKAMTSLCVLRDAQIRGKVFDDRPRGTDGFIRELNDKVKAMIDRVPEPVPPYLGEGNVDTYNG